MVKIKRFLDDLNYVEWKLRLFYNSQKNHTSSEIERMVELSLKENRDDLPF